MAADTSELDAYIQHLLYIPERVEKRLEPVVKRGAVNVKNTSRRNLASYSRRAYLKHYYRSIGFDMLSPLEAEIGPDKAMPQGGMGRGVEFGSLNAPPMPHLFPAFDQELPKFEKEALAAFYRAVR